MRTINGFLRLLFGVMVAFAVILLGRSAWNSWQELQTTERIKMATHASASMFSTMVNLRLEGSLTKGLLDRADIGTPLPFWQPSRDAQIKGYVASIAALQDTEIPNKDSIVSQLKSDLATLRTLHAETAAAITRAKAERPADLSQRYSDFTTNARKLLMDVGPVLQATVQLQDPVVDQLIGLHNLGWVMRSSAGDALTNITNNVAAIGKIPDDALAQQANMHGRVDLVWATITERLRSLPQSPELAKAIADAQSQYFDPAFREKQVSSLKQLMAGQKIDMTRDQWDQMVTPRVNTLAIVASNLIQEASRAADAKADAAVSSLEASLALLLGAVVFSVVVFMLIARRISRPLRAMTAEMQAIADGALETDISGVGRHDEIGVMAATLAIFRDGLKRNRELELESSHSRETSERDRKSMLAGLASQFESVVVDIVSSVSTSARELEAAAGMLRSATDETSQRSNNVAAAAEEASTNVANVASAAEELGASVQEIGRQVENSADMSQTAVREARSTAVVVGELSDAAHRISDVLGLISNIAGQTNLLALNATIEAARAGEAGRGFAVVAAEVKELANQTAKATADISLQINSIQSSTGRAVEAIGGIAGMIEDMNSLTLQVSNSIQDQNAATTEIVHSITQASAGTAEVTDNISSVARAAMHSGAAVNQVLSASSMLASKANQMRDEVDRFLRTVRAA